MYRSVPKNFTMTKKGQGEGASKGSNRIPVCVDPSFLVLWLIIYSSYPDNLFVVASESMVMEPTVQYHCAINT